MQNNTNNIINNIHFYSKFIDFLLKYQNFQFVRVKGNYYLLFRLKKF